MFTEQEINKAIELVAFLMECSKEEIGKVYGPNGLEALCVRLPDGSVICFPLVK